MRHEPGDVENETRLLERAIASGTRPTKDFCLKFLPKNVILSRAVKKHLSACERRARPILSPVAITGKLYLLELTAVAVPFIFR